MTTEAGNALRDSLNRIDRERRRITGLMYSLLLLTFIFWFAMCFSKDDHVGMPFGLAAVVCSVYVAGMMSSKVSTDNTRAILKAIEIAFQETASK